MTDTNTAADYEFVDDTIVDVVRSKELPRRLKDRICQTTEEREGVTLDRAGEITQTAEARYLDTRVDPPNPVRTVSAQSVGEPEIQIMMNMFHYAGVAEIDAAQRLPRLIELMDARKTPDAPMMTVYLEDEYTNNRELAHQVVWSIESTKILAFDDISTNIAGMAMQVNLNNETLLGCRPTYDDEGIVASEVAETIEDALDIKTRRKGTLIEFGPESPSYRRLLRPVEELRGIMFKGTRKVFRIVIRKENNESTGEEEFVLYAGGPAFDDALAIEGVDAFRTTSNNTHEVHKQLGIEAARKVIIDETISMLHERDLDGVDIRHPTLVVDITTNGGTIESIGHHGVSGSEGPVPARVAFEVTANRLLDAAIHGEEDDLDGTIENVVADKPITTGTGDADLRMGSLDIEDADANAAPELSDD